VSGPPLPFALGDSRPIGIFDSGVGGLSVLRHIRQQLPREHLIYLADQAHIPYGPRGGDEIRRFAAEITRFLLALGSKLIVVACNTASAAALDVLRVAFPEVGIVGMEPAIKPAASLTTTGKVGVLATPGTFTSPRYAALVDRFAQGLTVLEDPCLGLVEQVESGALDGPQTEAILDAAVGPMLAAGADTLVLGCTHYPFVIPLLERIVDGRAVIIDPAPAVARRAADVLQQNQLLAPESQRGSLRCLTTGDAGQLAEPVERLLGMQCLVEEARWRREHLGLASGPAASRE
jgi:glutamate racemase